MFGTEVEQPEDAGRSWSTPDVPVLPVDQLLPSLDGLQVELVRVAQVGSVHLSLDTEGLRESLASLEAVQRVLDASKAHLLYSVFQAGACDEVGLTAPSWLADKAKLPSGKVRFRFRTTLSLFDGTLAPVVDEALSAGAIGWAHVEVLAGATNSRNQDQMSSLAFHHVERAQVLSFGRWKQEVRLAASLFDPDGNEPDGDETHNRLSFAVSDRFTLLKGQLSPENAAVVAEAVEAVTDELFRSRQRDSEQTGDELKVPDRSTLRALALVEICRRAMAKEVGSTRPGHPEVSLTVGPDNFAHGTSRWGDAVTLVDSVLFCAPDLVTIFTDQYGNPKYMGPGLPFHMEPRPIGALGLTGNQLDQFIQDLKTKVPDGWDRVKWQLNRGRDIRYATPEQRQALAGRDGGCVFPGCEMPPAWTDAHHVDHWTSGGTTDIDNLISLCRRHHGVAHANGWSVALDSDGWTHWTTPNGYHLHGQRHQQHPVHSGGRCESSANSPPGGTDASARDG